MAPRHQIQIECTGHSWKRKGKWSFHLHNCPSLPGEDLDLTVDVGGDPVPWELRPRGNNCLMGGKWSAETDPKEEETWQKN